MSGLILLAVVVPLVWMLVRLATKIAGKAEKPLLRAAIKWSVLLVLRIKQAPNCRLSRCIKAALIATVLVLGLVGCGKTENANDRPVSYYLKDPDPCVRKAAQAIIDSGRPYPNEIWESNPEWANSAQQQRLARYDMWLGDRLYEMPGAWNWMRSHNFFHKHHPMKYVGVGSSVEDVLGIPKQVFKDWRVGGGLSGDFTCQIDQPPSSWVENQAELQPTVESIQLVQREPGRLLKVFEVSNRTDINMVEVFAESRLPNKSPGGQESQLVGYLPAEPGILQTVNGKTFHKAIWCSGRHDPDGPQSSGNCAIWLYVGPGIDARLSVAQQYLPFLPALHDKLLHDLESARRK